MATSQNGYSANDRSVIASYRVPGTTLRVALRKGDVSVVLLEYLRRYHLEVESLYHDPQDLWGYAERTIRGSATTLSNHASGTAVDTRAVRHPLGAVNTFTGDEEDALDDLLDDFEGVLRHGKDYQSRPDPMHCEVVGTPAQLRAVADRIRADGALVVTRPPLSTTDWFDMATADELKTAVREVLGQVIFETTGALPNRRGPNGAEQPGGGADTLFGFSINADGFGYRAEQALARIEAALRGEDPPAASVVDIPTPELLAELTRRYSSGGQS